MNEPSEAPWEPPPGEPITGEFVTENFGYDGGRQVTVYLPPDPPEAIVFAGDGQMVPHWGGFLETTDVPSTMIVGVHRAADETRRLHEYSPGFDPERFAAHERCDGGADIVMRERSQGTTVIDDLKLHRIDDRNCTRSRSPDPTRGVLS